MNEKQQSDCLIGLGFPLDRPAWSKRSDGLWWAIVTFQEMAGIKVDGVWGPQTQFAAYVVGQNGGRVSDHFTIREFACRCWERGHRGGDFCNGWPTSRRKLILGLERLREANGRSVYVVNGHRCKPYNAHVKGASGSQHVQGTAADVTQRLSRAAVTRLGVFTGIGYQRRGELVLHVDVRRGSTSSPATWPY